MQRIVLSSEGRELDEAIPAEDSCRHLTSKVRLKEHERHGNNPTCHYFKRVMGKGFVEEMALELGLGR